MATRSLAIAIVADFAVQWIAFSISAFAKRTEKYYGH
jgi:hypothetical protein